MRLLQDADPEDTSSEGPLFLEVVAIPEDVLV